MIKNNNLFDILNWVLKKKDIDLESKFTSFFIINRCLSMSSNYTSKIINNTVNIWSTKNNSFYNDNYILKFLKSVLPNNYKKISYIKKITETNKTDPNEEIFLSEISNGLQISEKELKNNLKLLKEIYD